jgi:hypothetical protein
MTSKRRNRSPGSAFYAVGVDFNNVLEFLAMGI